MIQKRTIQRESRRVWYGIRPFLPLIPIIVCAGTLKAGSATWNANPADNNWSNAANWTPATVPYGENDVATFGKSNVTGVNLGITRVGNAANFLGEIVFGPGASAYTITMTSVYGQTSFIEFDGGGIVNNSGITQNFIAGKSVISDSARIYFENSSAAGENVVITNQASEAGVPYGAFTSFDGSSTAGSATIVNEGAAESGTMWGGFTDLLFYSNAEAATFINNPGGASGAAAGHTLIQIFPPGGNLGTSTFIANPATVPGAEGGWVEMDVGTCAGSSFIANGATVADCQAGQIYAYGAENDTRLGLATFTANGGNGTNAQGGLIDIFHLPLSAGTVVIAKAGTNGGLGGTILLEDTDDAPVPEFRVFGNGTLDLSNLTANSIAIGSLAGNGMVLLAGHGLNVGGNNLSTSFTGLIQESGNLVKSGTGTLTLSGASTYTGGTSVSAGILKVANTTGSATGTGALSISAGTLGGKGAIAGAVTIGTGAGAGAFLAPGIEANQPAILRIKKALSFQADSTYACKLNTNNARADQVVAKGVTIQSGAQFSLQPVANRRLTIGTVFTVINNTAGPPIGGTFGNLPDNSTFTSGRNNYQASYEGGDGNDLTLTIIP